MKELEKTQVHWTSDSQFSLELGKPDYLRSYINAGSAKKARFIRKAICVRKKEARLEQPTVKKGQNRVPVFNESIN